MSSGCMDVCEISAKTAEELSETTRKALALSIESSLRRFYGVTDCRVDLEGRTAEIVLLMPRHERIIRQFGAIDQVLPHDILPVALDLADLPRAVKTAARSLFPEIIRELQLEDEFRVWKKQTRRIISGVIRRRREDLVEVELPGAMAILPKDARVPAEEPLYHAGSVLFFTISAVKRLPDRVLIRLSRSSRNLPARLFGFYLPMHRFVCVRRFIGQKSVVRTDANVRDRDVIRIREKVSAELQGEIIELRPF
ncbi:MAG: hypothetical protein ACOZF0_12860 [Thermodesulfobacteriota bacterium]